MRVCLCEKGFCFLHSSQQARRHGHYKSNANWPPRERIMRKNSVIVRSKGKLSISQDESHRHMNHIQMTIDANNKAKDRQSEDKKAVVTR